MGTRHLTMVKYDYGLRVAQYGQWDGYPSHTGNIILEFLRGVDIEKFKEKIKACCMVDREKISAMTDEQWEKYIAQNPQMSRDTGAKILKMIMENDKDEFTLLNDSEFGFNDLSCEWLYLIDLDSKTLTVRHNLVEPILATYSFDYLPQTMDGLDYVK